MEGAGTAAEFNWCPGIFLSRSYALQFVQWDRDQVAQSVFLGPRVQLPRTLESWDQYMEWRKGRVVTATTIRTVLPRWGVLPGARWLEPWASSLQGLCGQWGGAWRLDWR